MSETIVELWHVGNDAELKVHTLAGLSNSIRNIMN